MLVIFSLLTFFSAELSRLESETVVWSVTSPFGVFGQEFWESGLFASIWTAGLLILAVGSAAAVIVRYRRARGEARQQIKWLAYAVALFAATYSFSAIVRFETEFPLWLDILFYASILGIPIAIALAVIRYRLYDIDRIISRTVSYAVVAGVLVATYLGVVLALGAVVGRGNPLTVAGATLAAAALFNPVRRRVQGWVDRRFDRARYDAVRVVEGFTSRLRAEVDLEGLVTDLTGVVHTTLRPDRISIWLVEGMR
jgi:hypothetical protein